MSHYFIEDNTLEPHIETFTYFYIDKKYTFESNSGMFSPGHIDYATNLLIQKLPELSGSFLDLGCGYGVIGITMGKYYGLNVTLSDINGRALECAEKNSKLNNYPVKIIQSDCFDKIDGIFDTITLNPPIHAGKEVIFSMYEGSYDHLNKDGKFYVVIQKKHGAESTITKLKTLFRKVDTIYKKKGYYVIECDK